jgi:hypothetical protein
MRDNKNYLDFDLEAVREAAVKNLLTFLPDSFFRVCIDI